MWEMETKGPVILATYFDDFETGGADSGLDELKAKLVETFAVKRAAPEAPFVGLQCARDASSGAIMQHQQRYTQELFKGCGMRDANLPAAYGARGCAAPKRSQMIRSWGQACPSQQRLAR
jgi:hypothetical protein